MPPILACRRGELSMLMLSGRLAAIFTVLGLAGCTPLTLFDTLVPKDAAASAVAQNIAYGPDPRQSLDVYRPRASKAAAHLPIIVFIYGGSWNSGSKSGYAFVGRALAARGFLVVIPDYRLVPKVRYPAFLEDNASAVGWTIAHAAAFGGDPDRLVLAGHSAGAYNAAMLAYDDRWLGKDRARICGFIGLAGPYDFLPLQSDVAREAFQGTANLASTQPVNFAAPGAPPAFLATGSGDRTVMPHNSDALAGALQSKGAVVVRKSYAGLGHVGILTALALPFRGRAPVLADVIAFAKSASGPGKRLRTHVTQLGN